MSSKVAYKKKIEAKLKEPAEASEESWERLRDGVENTWGALQSALQNVAAKFKD